MTGETLQVVAYEMEVKGPLSSEWSTHLVKAEDVGDNPEEVWRDDHGVRNVKALVYAEEVPGENATLNNYGGENE